VELRILFLKDILVMLDLLYLGFGRLDECSLVCDDLFQAFDESADFLSRHPPTIVFRVCELRVRASGGGEVVPLARASSFSRNNRWFERLKRK
jgi:hypothetical protein